jgi:quercetin dioxygenase-like cupin family protein
MGETLRYPTNGPAHVTAAIVTLAPGARTVLHKHGVPLFAYVLEGEITVDYGDRGKRTYRQGDALMEAMNAAHFGADAGAQPVRILTVYMGADGAPRTSFLSSRELPAAKATPSPAYVHRTQRRSRPRSVGQ